MPDLIRLDDRDPQISYTPASDWLPGGGGPEYQGTTEGTSAAGARMTFTFTGQSLAHFLCPLPSLTVVTTGSYIAVYGTISHNLTTLPTSNTFTLTMSGRDTTHNSTWTAAPVVGSLYNVKMYESPQDIEYGLYTLIMNVGVKGSVTWIDYLELNQTNSSATSRASASSSPFSARSSTPTFATGSAMDSDQPPIQSQVPPEEMTQISTGLSSGAIAGIVVGVVALLVGALVFIWWWRKLHQISGRKRSDEGFTTGPTGNINHTAQYSVTAHLGSQGEFSPYQSSGVQRGVNRITSNSSVPVPRNEKRALKYLTNDVPPAYSV
ncbi:hypothetical protein PQX77_009126 [Marasmius sp. AFHP31]|nr:hypothetical protein PQX77_009126 [Marasmius sp. AFHP31]